MAAAAEQAGLVEMDVGVDETRQHQPAGGIDLGAPRRTSFGAIAAILPPEIPISTGAGAPRRAGVAEDEIEGGCTFMGPRTT